MTVASKVSKSVGVIRKSSFTRTVYFILFTCLFLFSILHFSVPFLIVRSNPELKTFFFPVVEVLT